MWVGRLIDLACTEPLIVAEHGRPVVMVMAFKKLTRLEAMDEGQQQAEAHIPSR